MKEQVSETQDHAFYRIGSLALIAVLFATVIVIFAWLMQKPIENQAATINETVAGAEVTNE